MTKTEMLMARSTGAGRSLRISTTNAEAIEKFKKIKRGNIYLIHQRCEGKVVIEDYSLCDMAISALEKQIPKELIAEGDGYADGKMVYDSFYCPSCDYHMEDYEVKNYCPNCGQAIDWDGER